MFAAARSMNFSCRFTLFSGRQNLYLWKSSQSTSNSIDSLKGLLLSPNEPLQLDFSISPVRDNEGSLMEDSSTPILSTADPRSSLENYDLIDLKPGINHVILLFKEQNRQQLEGQSQHVVFSLGSNYYGQGGLKADPKSIFSNFISINNEQEEEEFSLIPQPVNIPHSFPEVNDKKPCHISLAAGDFTGSVLYIIENASSNLRPLSKKLYVSSQVYTWGSGILGFGNSIFDGSPRSLIHSEHSFETSSAFRKLLFQLKNASSDDQIYINNIYSCGNYSLYTSSNGRILFLGVFRERIYDFENNTESGIFNRFLYRLVQDQGKKKWQDRGWITLNPLLLPKSIQMSDHDEIWLHSKYFVIFDKFKRQLKFIFVKSLFEINNGPPDLPSNDCGTEYPLNFDNGHFASLTEESFQDNLISLPSDFSLKKCIFHFFDGDTLYLLTDTFALLAILPPLCNQNLFPNFKSGSVQILTVFKEFCSSRELVDVTCSDNQIYFLLDSGDIYVWPLNDLLRISGSPPQLIQSCSSAKKLASHHSLIYAY